MFFIGDCQFSFYLIIFWKNMTSCQYIVCYRREEGTKYVDQLINCTEIDLDYSVCNLLTNNNTSERSFHSTKDPGRR